MPRTFSISTALLQALVDNLTTRAPKTPFVVAGKQYSAKSIVSMTKSVLTARAASSTAKGAWINARDADAKVEGEAIPVIAAVRIVLAQAVKNDARAMTDLRVAPRKAPKPLSAQERLAATAKNQATRIARGTQSKKEKAKVKGNVTGVAVTPITSQGPATSSPATSANDGTAVSASASPPANPATTASVAAVAGAPAATPALAAALPLVTGH